jgi:hypothetical protein
MEARYELGLTHLEMGKCLGDPSHLKQAEAIFVEMGAWFDLDQARELMQRLDGASSPVCGSKPLYYFK